MKQVAIQGFYGSFHDIAAHIYFGEDVLTVPCDTFKESIDWVVNHENGVGAIAIENTIAGSLLQNHHLLEESGLWIVGEHKLRIKQSLVAMPGQTLSDIREVHSHYMALLQCTDYLATQPHIKLIETDDTAKSAYEIAKTAQMGVAGICYADSARQFGLQVLAEGIETNKHNFTRFLMVAHRNNKALVPNPESCNKSSIVFTLPHEEGSLSKVLTILSFYNINLTKIQSLPIIGREWEYQFYVDLKFASYERYQQAIDAIRPLVSDIKVLGEYAEGEQTI